MSNQNKNWFALYIRVNQEYKTAEKLDKVGIEYYLPTVTKIRQWSDRKKKITEPVLKNYIFIYATESERMDALVLPTIVRCISENGRPAVIPEWQIENFKLVVESKTDFFVYGGIMPGQSVEILTGSLKGVKGIVNKIDNNKMSLAVSIEILNRSVIIQLPEGTEFRRCEK